MLSTLEQSIRGPSTLDRNQRLTAALKRVRGGKAVSRKEDEDVVFLTLLVLDRTTDFFPYSPTPPLFPPIRETREASLRAPERSEKSRRLSGAAREPIQPASHHPPARARALNRRPSARRERGRILKKKEDPLSARNHVFIGSLRCQVSSSETILIRGAFSRR